MRGYTTVPTVGRKAPLPRNGVARNRRERRALRTRAWQRTDREGNLAQADRPQLMWPNVAGAARADLRKAGLLSVDDGPAD